MKAKVYYHGLKGGNGYRSLSLYVKDDINVIFLGEVDYKDTNKTVPNITTSSNELPTKGEVLVLNTETNQHKLIEIC